MFWAAPSAMLAPNTIDLTHEQKVRCKAVILI